MKRIMNQYPGSLAKVGLGLLPFIIMLIAYVWVSDLRLAVNPDAIIKLDWSGCRAHGV